MNDETTRLSVQERMIYELRVRLAQAERRIAQQQLIIDRQNRRLARAEVSDRAAAEALFRSAPAL